MIIERSKFFTWFCRFCNTWNSPCREVCFNCQREQNKKEFIRRPMLRKEGKGLFV